MSHLKLMKLLYLTDRESLRLHGLSMTGDCLVSMPHGPVLSMTLNLMDGDVESGPNGWEDLITAKENHELSLKTELQPDTLDELSKADTDVLESIRQHVPLGNSRLHPPALQRMGRSSWLIAANQL